MNGAGGDGNTYTVQIDAGNGDIAAVAGCVTPTPTATPTGTPTPTPTPTFTPTPTPSTLLYTYMTTATEGNGDTTPGNACGQFVRDNQLLQSTRSSFYDIIVGDIIRDTDGNLYGGQSEWYGLETTADILPGKAIQIDNNGEVLAVSWCNTPTPTPTPTGITPTPTPTPTAVPSDPAWVPAGYEYFGSEETGMDYKLYKDTYIVGEFYYDGVFKDGSATSNEAIYWSQKFVNWVAQNVGVTPVEGQTYTRFLSGSGIAAYSASQEGVLTEVYRIDWDEVSTTIASWDDTFGTGGNFVGTQLTFASSSGDWADGTIHPNGGVESAERIVWRYWN